MARFKSGISQTRSLLYGIARLLGDISAIQRGPKATAKRIGRRVAGKATGKMLGRLCEPPLPSLRSGSGFLLHQQPVVLRQA